MTRLRHPSIVSRLDFSLEDSPRRLATEFISGSTLRAYSKDQIILPVVMVIRIFRLLREVLNYARGEGVIHRDLKPANLMIDASEGGVNLRILDFGIAIIDQFRS